MSDLEKSNEMAAALLAAFDDLMEKIKSRRPIDTKKRPTELGFVYSQLVQGMLVDPEDYKGAWTPSGGSSIQDVIDKGQAPAKGTVAAPAPAAGTPAAPAAPADGAAPAAPAAPDHKYLRSMEAAFKTAMLVDRMIMVTKDGSFLEYPGAGRKLSFAYNGMINGMQPLPPPPIAPDVQKRIDEAKKVLYVADDEGDLSIKSKAYKAYEKNARRYAEAVADYADAQAEASVDPAKAQSWPVKSKALRRGVDEAWDTLKTEGAEKVEAALDVIKSVGVSIDARMIGKARQTFDLWNLGLAGAVPVDVPYAYCSPSSWADYEQDDVGWMEIKVNSRTSKRKSGSDFNMFRRSRRDSSSSSTKASGGASYFGIGASAGYHRADARASDSSEHGRKLETFFHNDASNVTLEFEFGMVDIVRPWFSGDLFYLKNWYLVGNKKHAISDGTIDGQSENQDNLIPMVPMQMLVVRKVKISAESWGRDGSTLKELFGNSGGAWNKHQSGWNTSANVGFGPFSAKANVSREQAREGASRYGNVDATERKEYEAHFDGKTLTINGAQIIAFLSTIVPACPLMDDPGLGQKPAQPAAQPAPAAPAPAAPAPAPVA